MAKVSDKRSDMKKVKLLVFGLLPTLMMFLVSCSVPNVRTVGKEQHTGIIYILELTKDSMVFKGEDGTIYEAKVTKDSRNILNHVSQNGWSVSSIWGTLFYAETSSGWKVLRFTPDPNRQEQTAVVRCNGSVCWSGVYDDQPQPKTSAKTRKKK